jgi:DNA invertase Pin-like site-specific DNA recombinase
VLLHKPFAVNTKVFEHPADIENKMNIGYARVSTSEQNGNGQVKELDKVCDKVELEYASGGRWDRPCLQNILRGLKAGDCLVVWKLDRLTRSLRDLLQILEKLEEAGAGFRSLTEAIDTTTPVARMRMVHEGRSQTEVASLFRVSKSTICRLVSERRVIGASVTL